MLVTGCLSVLNCQNDLYKINNGIAAFIIIIVTSIKDKVWPKSVACTVDPKPIEMSA